MSGIKNGGNFVFILFFQFAGGHLKQKWENVWGREVTCFVGPKNSSHYATTDISMLKYLKNKHERILNYTIISAHQSNAKDFTAYINDVF
jgi:hypothetical protein